MFFSNKLYLLLLIFIVNAYSSSIQEKFDKEGFNFDDLSDKYSKNNNNNLEDQNKLNIRKQMIFYINNIKKTLKEYRFIIKENELSGILNKNLILFFELIFELINNNKENYNYELNYDYERFVNFINYLLSDNFAENNLEKIYEKIDEFENKRDCKTEQYALKFLEIFYNNFEVNFFSLNNIEMKISKFIEKKNIDFMGELENYINFYVEKKKNLYLNKESILKSINSLDINFKKIFYYIFLFKCFEILKIIEDKDFKNYNFINIDGINAITEENISYMMDKKQTFNFIEYIYFYVNNKLKLNIVKNNENNNIKDIIYSYTSSLSGIFFKSKV